MSEKRKPMLPTLTMTSILAICLTCQALGYGQGQAPAPTPAPAAEDIGWPRQITKDGTVFVYYQPQLDEWKDYKQLVGRVAFSLTPKGGDAVLGVLNFQAGTIVDKESRTAFIRDITVTEVRFPSLSATNAGVMERILRPMVPTGGEPISIDRLLADLEKNDQIQARAVVVKNDPPPIYYSSRSAVLLMVDGDPVLAPIEKTDLQFIVNTNWDLFFDKSKKQYFLLVENGWLTAKELKGPWTTTQVVPKDMEKLPAGQNFDDVKKMVPPPPPSGTVPQVFFSSVPAELVLTQGAPVYTKIPGTQLLFVANTESDLFADNTARQFYILLSGRWFRSTSLAGPWIYAGNTLPADFAKIPSDSPRSRVLASVPGTVEAADAVMLAQVPTTAIVNRAEVEAKVKVTYDGAPQFKPIEGTSLQYASNTPEKVIKVGDLYYLCFQGVWFTSAKPAGPWKTADSVPKEIYTIPPSSPVYNTTYVTQTNATATTVECSHTSGYVGAFVVGMTAGMIITYGTGYYYPPYVYWGPGWGYPVYRPYPYTYGVGAVYNPWTGGWATGRSAYGPYGAAHASAWYNPATGRYGRSASVQGWYGGRTVASAYNPWTGGYGATSQGHNGYAQWGQSAAVRGDQWARTGHVTTSRGTVAGYQTSSGQQGVVARGSNGTVARTDNGVYAGHDGNVYRKDSSGNWSQYNNGSWNSVDTSAQRAQAQQNLQNRQQQAQPGQTTSTGAGQQIQNRQPQQSTQNRPQTSQTMQQRNPNTMQSLNNSAASRQRGQAQTQQYRTQRAGGGGMRRR